jgi:hypothetical protein
MLPPNIGEKRGRRKRKGGEEGWLVVKTSNRKGEKKTRVRKFVCNNL